MRIPASIMQEAFAFRAGSSSFRGGRNADIQGGCGGLGYRPKPSPIRLITLRNAQVRRISWVRGVRPAWERCEWPPHDIAPGRPPFRHELLPLSTAAIQ